MRSSSPAPTKCDGSLLMDDFFFRVPLAPPQPSLRDVFSALTSFAAIARVQAHQRGGKGRLGPACRTGPPALSRCSWSPLCAPRRDKGKEEGGDLPAGLAMRARGADDRPGQMEHSDALRGE